MSEFQASGTFYTSCGALRVADFTSVSAMIPQQHNDSFHRGWTNRYRPWILIHQEAYRTYALARKREIELKAQKGGVGFYEKTGIDPNQ